MRRANPFNQFDPYHLEPSLTRLMRLAHRNDPDTSADTGAGGTGTGGANQDEYRTRRLRELEGTAADALKGQVLQLETDNKKSRDEMRALRAQLKELEPVKGELEGYRSFGKADELKARLETLEAERAELTGFRRERAVHEAARVTRLEDGRGVSAEKLADLVKLKGFDLELQEVMGQDEDGKPVKVKAAFVKPSKAGEKAMPLLEYIAAELPTFVDWIAADDSANTGARASTTGPAGARVAGQASGGSGAAKTSTVQDIVKQKRASGTYQI